jgi:flagellar biosynthesis/type III secretory pathway protein FliH
VGSLMTAARSVVEGELMADTQLRPRFQQAVYDEGYRDGRAAGFKAGEEYGRRLQRLHDELKPAIAFVLGILVMTFVGLTLKTVGLLP